MHLITLLLLLQFTTVLGWYVPQKYNTKRVCTVEVDPNGGDDAPAVLKAFSDCGHGGNVVFKNTTYHINSVMNTTGLSDCKIDLYGTLLWSTDINYWLNHSLPVGYQNQSSAWFLGGENLTFDGHGYGTLNGQGQAWYDFVKGASNYPRRPHAITIWNTQNSFFSGIRFLQSQMWTMTVMHSQNVLLQDIYVKSVSNNSNSNVNTDGADTIYADHIHFDRWTVTNGDDSISPKANSTNILVTNSTFINGVGFALGSIGQYLNTYEIIENFTASNIIFQNTLHTAYIKTWTGQQIGYPPNGGGGGIGHVKNVLLENFSATNVLNAFSITQCITFSTGGDCNTSKFQIEGITVRNVTGTMRQDPIASLQCSAAAPCIDIALEDVELNLANGTPAINHTCSYVASYSGFNCSGPTCEKPSAAGTC